MRGTRVVAGSAFVGVRNGAAPGSPARARALRVLAPVAARACSIAAVSTEDPLVALTFDDGPDPVWTPVVLDVLARHGATATFFLLAGKAERSPDLVRAVLERGHEIGLHGLDHTRLPALPKHEARRRIGEGKARLESVTGRPVQLFRPAYGAQRWNELRAAQRLGLTTIIWNAWAEDWRDQPPAEVARRGADACGPGTILLLHDSADADGAADAGEPFSAPTFDRGEAVDLLLQELHRRCLTGTDVTRLLTGRQPVLVPWLVR